LRTNIDLIKQKEQYKMVKNIFKVVMVVAIIFMAFLCYRSIEEPIEFENQKEIRQAAVIKRLVDIRKAEMDFKDAKGHYTASFDSLITFVKTAKKAVVRKEGRITDQQLSKGLTEKKALKLTRAEAAQYGVDNYDAFKASFKRDTVFESILVAEFGANYPIDSIAYVPFTNGQKFTLETGSYTNKSEQVIPLFEARVDNNIYLNGLNRQEIVNMNDDAENLGKYAGLKVGDKTTPNNNAGNWE